MRIESGRQFWNLILVFSAVWLPMITYSKYLQNTGKKAFGWKSIRVPFFYFLLTLAAYICLQDNVTRAVCGGFSLLFGLILFIRDKFF
jgi:hypothetical protein